MFTRKGVRDVDWHLFEVSLVTILAVWVYLFSPSPLSRGVAVTMLVINVVWVLLDPDGQRTRQRAMQSVAPPVNNAQAQEVEEQADKPRGII